MTIDLEFVLDNNTISIEYHSFIVSFLKKSLENMNSDLYNQLYGNEKANIKTFTYSVYFDSPKFINDRIILKSNKLIVHFKDYDIQEGLYFYNAFNAMMKKNINFPLNKNRMKLIRIFFKMEKSIEDDNLIVQFVSPLVVRKHDKTSNQDLYYTYQDEEFKETLEENLKNIISELGYSISTQGFDIIPLKNKKTVVKLYHHCMNASLGLFQIKGNPQLLDFLWKAGIGSLRSSGFGSFKIIK